MSEGYLPGYGRQTSRMLNARTLESRAPLTATRLRAGSRVLDVGCGPGTITAGLAARVGPTGRVTALDVSPGQLRAARESRSRAALGFAAGSVYALPLPAAGTDLAFAHAVVEHLTDPRAALAELARVLRPDAVLALVSSDWSGAVVDPPDPDVSTAIEGYRQLRRSTGADPDAGAHLDDLVTAAGFTVVEQSSRHHRDMAGAELARYIHHRLDRFSTSVPPTSARPLDQARHAARRWVTRPRPAAVLQHWTEVIAVRTVSEITAGRFGATMG